PPPRVGKAAGRPTAGSGETHGTHADGQYAVEGFLRGAAKRAAGGGSVRGEDTGAVQPAAAPVDARAAGPGPQEAPGRAAQGERGLCHEAARPAAAPAGGKQPVRRDGHLRRQDLAPQQQPHPRPAAARPAV
ncbi:hypothetical protein H4R21_006442, partial [Coemansia helicoidea]